MVVFLNYKKICLIIVKLYPGAVRDAGKELEMFVYYTVFTLGLTTAVEEGAAKGSPYPFL